MVKELKQLHSIEALECSDSVKHKTRDFVRKYMSKYGSVFKRDPNDTKEYWVCLAGWLTKKSQGVWESQLWFTVKGKSVVVKVKAVYSLYPEWFRWWETGLGTLSRRLHPSPWAYAQFWRVEGK